MSGRLAALIAVAALLGACTKDLSDLQPFPCPVDKACPEGLACNQGQCKPVAPESDCVHGTVDCNQIGSAGVCWKGVMCEPVCGAVDGGMCGTGRVCAAGGCLIDCTANGICPSELVCHTLGVGPKRACMPAALYVPACASFAPRPTIECIGQCPNKDIPCGSGACPHNSICMSSTNWCQCGPGYVGIECNGSACPGSGCTGDWGCTWTLPPARCDTIAPGPGVCTCRDGVTIERGCSATPCEQLCTDEEMSRLPR